MTQHQEDAAEPADPSSDPALAPVGSSEAGGDSGLTVWLALAANLGVGLLKLAAGLVTGSAALLSEAAHSAGDTTTEIFLLVAQKRSQKPADRSHPFGYGKERYFWSVIAAGAIFASGAAFSIYQGVTTILEGETSELLWINYPVLAVSAILEGTSLRQAVKQMEGETRRLRTTVWQYLRTPRDPTVESVLLEDSAAIVGLIIAALGVGLHQLTGSPVFDGIASVMIGVLLLVVSGTLARACKNLLIGQQADVRLMREIEGWLEQQPEVDDVVDMLSMYTGVDSVLLCTRVDFVESASGADLEKACVRLDLEMREKWPNLDEIFIQPASKADDTMRRRVQARYGEALAERA